MEILAPMITAIMENATIPHRIAMSQMIAPSVPSTARIALKYPNATIGILALPIYAIAMVYATIKTGATTEIHAQSTAVTDTVIALIARRSAAMERYA